MRSEGQRQSRINVAEAHKSEVILARFLREARTAARLQSEHVARVLDVGTLDGDVPFWPGITDMTSGGYYRHAWPAARNARLTYSGREGERRPQ